jgi:enoyl-CoA hydratase/carnithine racemase
MFSVKDTAVEESTLSPVCLVSNDTQPVRRDGLDVRRLDGLDAVVVTKSVAGFDAPAIEGVRQILRDARGGQLAPLKFLVFDFAHETLQDGQAVDGFDALIIEIANLILAAPIVAVANVRAGVGGADLEFALACSMLIGEEGAQFSFAADPIAAIGTYGFLAQKIGFVRAERLMEGGEVLDAAQMQEQLLLKAIAPQGAGLEGVEAFVGKAMRRHNASYGIYRAQRIASPLRLAVA